MRRFHALTAQFMDSSCLVLHSGRLGEAVGWPFYLNEQINSAHTECMLSFS